MCSVLHQIRGKALHFFVFVYILHNITFEKLPQLPKKSLFLFYYCNFFGKMLLYNCHLETLPITLLETMPKTFRNNISAKTNNRKNRKRKKVSHYEKEIIERCFERNNGSDNACRLRQQRQRKHGYAAARRITGAGTVARSRYTAACSGYTDTGIRRRKGLLLKFQA